MSSTLSIQEKSSKLQTKMPTIDEETVSQIREDTQHVFSQSLETDSRAQPYCSFKKLSLAGIGIAAFFIASYAASQKDQKLVIGASVVSGVAFTILFGIVLYSQCNHQSDNLENISNEANQLGDQNVVTSYSDKTQT